nr:hypothetical protein [Tanacetum cinerariifolium]
MVMWHLGSNSATRTPNVLNASLESFSTLSEAHGIHSPASENEENTSDVGPKVGPTPSGNTLGLSSYVNVTSVLSRKALNFRTLFTPAGNGIDVVVSVESIRPISEWNTWDKYGLVKSMLYSSINIFSFQFSSIDGLDAADMELKDNIVVALPKLIMEGFYTCTVHVEYEWKPPSTSTTLIVEKVDNIVRLIIEGKATLVDDEGKLLAKVDSLDDHDSEDEVASVDNDMANYLASNKGGYGTNSLLEQWKETYENDEYDFDP